MPKKLLFKILTNVLMFKLGIGVLFMYLENRCKMIIFLERIDSLHINIFLKLINQADTLGIRNTQSFTHELVF